MNTKPLNIIVLLGGWSSEREVSLTSGNAIIDSLNRLGHKVKAIDPPHDLSELILALKPSADFKPDLIFNALHGKWGEDGHFQAISEIMQIPMTHSNMVSSAIAMDKDITKTILAANGLSVPKGYKMNARSLAKYQPMERPFVIKPVSEGSSVGVFIVKEGDQMPALDNFENQPLLIEEYIPGRELTTAVLGGRGLSVTELIPKQGFYDYRAKYTMGETLHICPADIPPALFERCKILAETAHNALGCKGASRTDFRYDEHGENGTKGRLVILEVNTQPGMTPLSLVPEQALQQGMSFDQLVQWMVEDSL